jgi:drug/metabolite transporter (DMT)-like permease
VRKSLGATPVFLLIFLSLIWGTSFILIKQGLKVFAPDQVGALRVTAAMIFLLPLALPRLKELRGGDGWKLFLSGMMGIFLPAFLFSIAQTRLDSSVAGILNTLSPLWTMILGAAFFQQRFRSYAIVGIVLSFVGAVWLALSRSGDAISGINLYAFLIVAACLLYGANLNWVKFKIPHLGAITIASVSVVLTSPLAAVYLFGFTDFTQKLQTVPGAWRAAGFICLLAFMGTALANLIFNQLVKMTTPLYASTVTYIMPLVAVMWGVLDGEVLTLWHFIGMGLIISGVYLANKK